LAAEAVIGIRGAGKTQQLSRTPQSSLRTNGFRQAVSCVTINIHFMQFFGIQLLISLQTANQQTCASDNELMEAVVSRKEEALECIHKRYESLLHTVIMGIMRDESEVDGILHEVLLQVWEQGHRYNPNDKGLRGLLVTLARRRSLDRLRRRAAYRRATESLKTDSDNPLTYERAPTINQVEVNDLSAVLNRVIQKLPAEQKEVIDLAFFKGMSQREIAAKKQIALGTVKTRLHLARQKLHNYLLPMQNEILTVPVFAR